jgi:hypothetical protein
LIYEFENGYKLILTKKKTDIIIRLTIDDKMYHPVKVMDTLTRKLFKSFGNHESTFEFNKLYDFIHIE